MKIQITSPVLNYEDKPVLEKDEDGKLTEITWRDIVYTALNTFRNDEQLTSEQKSKSYAITSKIFASKEPDLTVEERGYILERIEKINQSPLVYGRSRQFFEDTKKKE